MKRILAILCAMACLFALALPAMAADKITVTAYVPKGVEGWKIHFWGGTGPESTWPGVDMVKVEDGVYKVEIDSGYTGFLIHSNENPKSADQVMSGTQDVWVVFDGTNASVHDSDPGPNATPNPGTTPAPNPGGNGGDLSGLNELYIVGSGMPGIDEWSTTCANGKMTANGTTYTIKLGLPKGTAIAFKFAGNGSWESGFNYGGEGETAVTAGTPVSLKNDGSSGNLTYTASQDCNLTVTVDLAANTVKVEEVPGTPETPKPAPPEFPENLYMAGQGIPGASGDWIEKDDAMILSGKDGVYSIALEMTAGTTFMFKFTAGSWSVNFGGEAEGVVVENGKDVTLVSNGKDLSYTAAADGTATFTVDLNKNTLNVTAGVIETPGADEDDDNKNDNTDNNTDSKDEATQPTTAENNEKKDEKKDNTTLIIILAIVGVVAAGTAVAVVLILKKK